MLTHTQIWSGIDALARQAGLTPSGLARLSGLDPTTFNKSKRFAGDGAKPRWPSTESISKVLEATGATFEEFAALADGRPGHGRAVPLLGLAQAGANGFFDDSGLPAGAAWDRIHFPEESREGVYALEISGDSMEPVYRAGDRIIVAPGEPVRRGDRIVVKTAGGEVMAKELGRVSDRSIEVLSLNPDHAARTLDVGEVVWIARILWASQ